MRRDDAQLEADLRARVVRSSEQSERRGQAHLGGPSLRYKEFFSRMVVQAVMSLGEGMPLSAIGIKKVPERRGQRREPPATTKLLFARALLLVAISSGHAISGGHRRCCDRLDARRRRGLQEDLQLRGLRAAAEDFRQREGATLLCFPAPESFRARIC